MLTPKFPYRDDGLRVVAAFLTLSLALPSSALALRNEAAAEEKSGVLAGLEEALQGKPNHLIQLAKTALGPSVLSPKSAAGLEERVLQPERILEAASWRELFGETGPISVRLEIGPGTGDVLFYRASQAFRRDPSSRFIAVELPSGAGPQGAGSKLNMAERKLGDHQFEEYPPNVRFVFEDIKDFLSYMGHLPRVQEIFIDFPSPGTYFDDGSTLQELIRRLDPKGEFLVRTGQQNILDAFENAIGQVGNRDGLKIRNEEESDHLPETPYSFLQREKLGWPIKLARYAPSAAGLEEWKGAWVNQLYFEPQTPNQSKGVVIKEGADPATQDTIRVTLEERRGSLARVSFSVSDAAGTWAPEDVVILRTSILRRLLEENEIVPPNTMNEIWVPRWAGFNLKDPTAVTALNDPRLKNALVENKEAVLKKKREGGGKKPLVLGLQEPKETILSTNGNRWEGGEGAVLFNTRGGRSEIQNWHPIAQITVSEVNDNHARMAIYLSQRVRASREKKRDTLLGKTPSAGLEEGADLRSRIREAVSGLKQNVVVLLDVKLFDPATSAKLTDPADTTLIGLWMRLRDDVLPWPKEHPVDLEIAVVTDENRAATQETYKGWRVIEVQRKPGTEAKPLPLSALPRVVADALAARTGLLQIDVTPYLDLGSQTMDEALENLRELIFA